MGSSWSVVSTIRAPKWQVDDFVGFYLNAGAEAVFLFFDDPEKADYTPHPKVEVVVCDPDSWEARGGRPEAIETRQYANHSTARDMCVSEWLLHVDVDELLYSPRPISDILAGVPENVFSVLAPTREAVFHEMPSETSMFATPFFKNYNFGKWSLINDLYGPELASSSWRGLWGHAIGKTFVRQGMPIKRRSCHKPVPEDESLVQNLETGEIELLHYEGQTFEEFREKSMRRINRDVHVAYLGPRQEARLEAIREAYEANGDEGLREVFARLYVLSPEQIVKAIQQGYIETRRIDLGRRGLKQKLLQFHQQMRVDRLVGDIEGRVKETASSCA